MTTTVMASAAVWSLWLVALPVAYLLGTFPSAHLVARAHGVDITTVGSGNPGASNVTRALGWRAGVWVFVLDAAKGAISAGAGLWLWGRPAAYLLGAAAVLGHIAPLTRRLRGGKGVATGGGVILVVLPLVGAAVIALWWVVTRVSRTPAVGSIVAVTAAGIGLALTGPPPWELAATIGLCALILSRHLGNVHRLLRRQEHAIGSERRRSDTGNIADTADTTDTVHTGGTVSHPVVTDSEGPADTGWAPGATTGENRP